MATIVTNTEEGGTFILLGGGYGAYRATSPHVFFGSLAPNTDHGEHSLALVCDAKGRIGWMEVRIMRVVSVDGVSPAKALEQPDPQDTLRS